MGVTLGILIICIAIYAGNIVLLGRIHDDLEAIERCLRNMAKTKEKK